MQCFGITLFLLFAVATPVPDSLSHLIPIYICTVYMYYMYIHNIHNLRYTIVGQEILGPSTLQKLWKIVAGPSHDFCSSALFFDDHNLIWQKWWEWLLLLIQHQSYKWNFKFVDWFAFYLSVIVKPWWGGWHRKSISYLLERKFNLFSYLVWINSSHW